MKKFTVVSILIMFLLSISISVYATEGITVSADGETLISGFDPLIDSADLLTEEEEKQVLSRIVDIHENHDWDVTFLTMDFVPDGEYLDTYTHWYEGLDPTRDGLVFAINMDHDNRGYTTSRRKSAENDFTSYALDKVDEEVAPLLTSESYAEALNLFLDYTETCIEYAEEGNGYYYKNTPTGKSTNAAIAILAGIIAATIIALVVIIIISKKMNTAIKQSEAKGFVKKDSLTLTINEDVFISENTTSVRVVSDDEDSGGSSSGFGGSRSGRSGSF